MTRCNEICYHEPIFEYCKHSTKDTQRKISPHPITGQCHDHNKPHLCVKVEAEQKQV